MKTLLAIAIGAILTTACGDSGNDDSRPATGADPLPTDPAAPVTNPTPNPMTPVDTGSDIGAPGVDAPGVDAPDADAPMVDDATPPLTSDPAPDDDSPAEPDTVDVPVGTDAPAASATITTDNYVDVLSEVFATFTGNNFAAEVFPIYRAYPLGLSGAELFALNVNQTTIPLTCENGGTGTYTGRERWTFDGCQTGARVLDGEFTADPVTDDGSLFVFDSSGISSESQAASVAFTGALQYLPRGSRGNQYLRWNAEIERLDLSEGDEVRVLRDLATDYYYGREGNGFDVTMNLTGAFTVQAPVTGGRAVSVRVTEPLVRAFDPGLSDDEREVADLATTTFRSGTLRLTAPDGNVLELDAATGDDTTAEITITANGIRETLVADWSVWIDELRIARDGRLVDIEDF